MPKPSSLSLSVGKDRTTSSPESISPRHVVPVKTSDEPTTALPEPPQLQPSPRKQPQHGRTAAPVRKPDTPKTTYPYRDSPAASVRSLSHGNLLETASVGSASAYGDDAISESGYSQPTSGPDQSRDRRPSRHNLFQGLVKRATSTRTDATSSRIPPKIQTSSRERRKTSRSRERKISTIQESPQTAPLSPERGFRDAMASSDVRNHSADRAVNGSHGTHDAESRTAGPSRLTNLLTSSQKAAGDIGKAGKGMFSRFARRPSTHESEVAPEDYQFVVIYQPLVDQVRKTRLRSRMLDARDKTEFWLPALPYRCIDYLNDKGVEHEGLYRMAGSRTEITQWKIRFDKELDIDLLSEPRLYDVNVVANLLQDWLRNIRDTDPLFPMSTQQRIVDECEAEYGAGNSAPPMLKDELSKLPPYKYYLLFAITAHITLVSKFSEANKMGYDNLVTCFSPCMGLHIFCFKFLVNDWRNCWQGCFTEAEYHEEEKAIYAANPPRISHPIPIPPDPTEVPAAKKQVELTATTEELYANAIRPKTGRTKSGSISGKKATTVSDTKAENKSGSNSEKNSAPPSPKEAKRKGSFSSLKAKLKPKEKENAKLSEPAIAPELGFVDPISPIKM